MNSTSVSALYWSLYKQEQAGTVVKLSVRWCSYVVSMAGNPQTALQAESFIDNRFIKEGWRHCNHLHFWLLALHYCFYLYSDRGASLVWCLSRYTPTDSYPTLMLLSIPPPLLIFVRGLTCHQENPRVLICQKNIFCPEMINRCVVVSWLKDLTPRLGSLPGLQHPK